MEWAKLKKEWKWQIWKEIKGTLCIKYVYFPKEKKQNTRLEW
jgi:hypothetical protein